MRPTLASFNTNALTGKLLVDLWRVPIDLVATTKLPKIVLPPSIHQATGSNSKRMIPAATY
jgi:hypothetical protein